MRVLRIVSEPHLSRRQLGPAHGTLMTMQRTIEARLNAPAVRVFTVLEDLATYPDWLDMVARVEPIVAVEADAPAAWFVTLRARIGPFARSKRLRMIRTTCDEPTTLRFERAETDGRTHSPWQLDVAVRGDDPCDVEVQLSYGGGLWTAALDVVLGTQTKDAVPRLQSLVES